MTPDPRRWWTLAVVTLAVTIVAVDTTVLNVSLPTIIRELHTTLPSVQWVLSGYSLTYASLLVVAGRLGDLYGQRRILIAGALLFGVGSLIASLSTSVPQLILGEAVIEGIGAALLTPSSLALLSQTFQGRERLMAFAVWGSVMGVVVALGPLFGGYLTTYHSWRWAFRINVLVVPVVIVASLVVMRRDVVERVRPAIDAAGALLIAAATFFLVFGFTQSSVYGWWRPLRDVSVGGVVLWPHHFGVSVIPFTFFLAAVLGVVFVLVEVTKERDRGDPLFPFSDFGIKSFRYGVLVAFFMSVAQFGMMLVIPLFLQATRHLTPMQNGLWMCPMGLTIVVASPLGGRLARMVGTATMVAVGVTIDAAALVVEAFLLRRGVTFLQLLPVLVVYGLGAGFANSQLTNVVLADIDPARVGAASGINSTARQTGGSLGVAVIGSVFAMVASRHGAGHATRPAVLLATAMMSLGALAAWRIPNDLGGELPAIDEDVEVALGVSQATSAPT